MIINLYDMFCTDTLRHRESARKVIQKIPKNTHVTLNFEKIDFTSRSFLHELLSGLTSDHSVEFSNLTREVKQMMEIIKRRSLCVQC